MAEPVCPADNLEARTLPCSGACLIRQVCRSATVSRHVAAAAWIRQAHADILVTAPSGTWTHAGRTVDGDHPCASWIASMCSTSAGGPAYVAGAHGRRAAVHERPGVRRRSFVESATKRRSAQHRGQPSERRSRLRGHRSATADGARAPMRDDDSPPSAMLDSASDARVEPWYAVSADGLVLFKGAVAASRPPKQGKSTACWTDLAPLTREHLAARHRRRQNASRSGGPTTRRMIAATGGNPCRPSLGIAPAKCVAGRPSSLAIFPAPASWPRSSTPAFDVRLGRNATRSNPSARLTRSARGGCRRR